MNPVTSALSNPAMEDRARKTFYPTPVALADKMMDGIDWHFVSSILEPSAGRGDLAIRAMQRKYQSCHGYIPRESDYGYKDMLAQVDMDCVEIDPYLRQTLKDRKLRIVHDDFLTFETQKRYSLIVMNPPFDDGDKHLLKALELMKYGGEIRCLLNAETVRNPYTESRRVLLSALKAYNADIEFVSGAFSDADRETDVEVAVVRCTIPQAKPDSTIMNDLRRAPTWKKAEVPVEYTDMVQYNAIDEIVSRYNFEVACGLRIIDEHRAMNSSMLKIDGDVGGTFLIDVTVHSSNGDDPNAYIRAVRKKYWGYIFTNDKIIKNMTSNLQRDLRESVEEFANYEFSFYNIMTLIINMNEKLVSGIEDTIVKLFDDWTRNSWNEESPNRHYYNGWKTNDSFKIGKKVIIPFYSFSRFLGDFEPYQIMSKFRDIEKVFDFLDSGRTDYIGDFVAAFETAQKLRNYRNIDTKYFTVTLYKKGTAHLVFKDEAILEKLNLFAGKKKGWLPTAYGKVRYDDMTDEEKAVVDSFQGKDGYEKVMRDRAWYLPDAASQPLLAIA